MYVDSGSTDGSIEHARDNGVDVVELDMDTPFTVARARNAGFDRVRETHPDIEYIQFVDGDCEVIDGWLEKALAYLEEHDEVAAVSGRRHERYPDKTIYNRLTDMEWNVAPGEVRCFGGDTPYRKPQVELSRIVLDRLGVAAEATIMIGDSPFDIEAASCVGMTSFCVPTGSHSLQELEEAGADRIFESLQAVADTVFS